MNEIKNQRKPHWIVDIIFIVLFTLMPGIRGYDNWAWYEYLVFVLIPVAWLINDIIQKTKKG